MFYCIIKVIYYIRKCRFYGTFSAASQNEILDIQAFNKRTNLRKFLVDNRVYRHWMFFLSLEYWSISVDMENMR